MIGRKEEVKTLKTVLKRKKSSFLAITGRRRVGKTYLVDRFFKDHICYRLTGIQNGSFEEQVNNFSLKVAEYSNTIILSPPKNWQEAFLLLKTYLTTLDKRSKRVIFIDELPWVVTAKSNFLQQLAHLWNDYLSKEEHFVLVVCGSSSSWLVKNVVNDTGGLHNRLSDRINLKPFTLKESKDFLDSLNIRLNNQEVSKIYMALGGIPFYLEQIRKGESAASALERICFSDIGTLTNEYNNLYKALFKNASNHEAVVTALAAKPSGLTRKEIISQSKLSAGGVYNRTISDLVESGFITEFIPYGKKKRGVKYRLNDEFSIFYHRFMKRNSKYVKGVWNQISAKQSYKIWLGFAFENLCFKHIDQLKIAMGISSVYTEISSLQVSSNSVTEGFQIDLILDRSDNVINLFEIKYYDGTFVLDKKYADTIINRRQQFIAYTKTKKLVFNSMVSNYGLTDNQYASGVIDSSFVLNDLFQG